MCLLSPSPCLSFESGKSRLYYWTPAPVLANHLACVIDLLNAHFIAGNPPPRIFQKADRVVIGNLLAGEKRGKIIALKWLPLKAVPRLSLLVP